MGCVLRRTATKNRDALRRKKHGNHWCALSMKVIRKITYRQFPTHPKFNEIWNMNIFIRRRTPQEDPKGRTS